MIHTNKMDARVEPAHDDFNPIGKCSKERGRRDMLAPTDKPTLRPYLAAARDFASGADTPRAFLERCLAALDAWEPKIGAFVNLNLKDARAAADAATQRRRDGRPLSAIDGMPVGIKDIIETIDMPTENGSPLFAGFRSERDAASVVALREAGAVIVGKTVTTEFASTFPRGTRNPWDLERTPGGSSSGSAAAVGVGILSAALGTQVIGSTIRPASYCGCYGFKPTVGALNRGGSYDGLSQSCTGTLAATLDECWQVAYEIAKRAGGDPGYPGLYGPDKPPAAVKPRRLIVLDTAGWAVASAGARQAIKDALSRIAAAGVELVTRGSNREVEAIEQEIAEARPRSMRINGWEWRWPLNTFRNRDATKISKHALERLAEAEAMSLDDYRPLLAERDKVRAQYAKLSAQGDACISLAAPGPAPRGLDSTGDPSCTVHTSYLGVPAISLPLLADEGLPLGLQVVGFEHKDAATFATAAWIETCLAATRG
jgi:Asp-tRNA(Asn)/Glu-tRNA(Gln) amidotransferase A subunit family amidase